MATIRLFVGEEGREFVVSKKLLESTSPYFREKLDSAAINVGHKGIAKPNIIWLGDRSSDMFELFVYWIHHRGNFEYVIEDAEAEDTCEDLLWDLVNLHVFAAHIRLAALQDIAIDAIQDLHLRRNWDISPKLVSYVYTELDPDESCRLRKWIVAMTAWMLGGGLEKLGTVEKMDVLFRECSDFWADYVAHLSKTSKNHIQLACKNPQLRLPSNNLRGEERQFGYRMCSFHTHRSVVGQGRCPHQLLQSPSRSPVSSSSDGEDLWTVLRKDSITPRTAIFDMYSQMNMRQ